MNEKLNSHILKLLSLTVYYFFYKSACEACKKQKNGQVKIYKFIQACEVEQQNVV